MEKVRSILKIKSNHSLIIGSSFIKPYRKEVIFAMLALLFTAGITLSIGQGVRLMIDDGFATQSVKLLERSIIFFFILVAALSIGTFARYYWVSWVGERVVTDIRKRVFDHLINLSPGFFETNRGLEIQSRMTVDTTLLQSVIGSSVSIALRNMIMLIGGIIWLFITNAKLTGIVMSAVPLVVAPIIFFGRHVRGLSRQSQDRIADVGSYVGEVLGNIKTVQAYNHQEQDKVKFAGVAEEAFDVAKHRIKHRAWLIAVVILLVLGAIGFMLWVGGTDVIEGKISGGELAAFVFYSIIVGSAIGSVSEVIGELQRAAGAMERIVELLESKSSIVSPVEMIKFLPVKLVKGSIELKSVNFSYPLRIEVKAIDDLSLYVKGGETLALVGSSGAGKSTLFDLMLRFFDPQSGKISIDGIDVRHLDLKDLRRCFALVSQQPALFYGTVKDNISYGKPEASMDELIAVAKAAHAHEFISKLPDGYQSRLGDGGIGLSGGQKQRLAIARALLIDAPILLLDEATSALDAESEFLIQEALEKLMENKTTIVIAHRLATVMNADRIAVINEGKLMAIGRHEELIETNEIYTRFAKLQFGSSV
jgi:ATP-binding cassette subfamily B protein